MYTGVYIYVCVYLVQSSISLLDLNTKTPNKFLTPGSYTHQRGKETLGKRGGFEKINASENVSVAQDVGADNI